MKTIITKALFFSMFAFLFACGSTEKEQDQQLSQKINQQAPANSSEEILQRAASMFANAEGLTAEQKEKLTSIYTKVYIESMQIRKDLGKSKSLLFSTLSKPDYQPSEITNLKKRIVDLDQKRLDVMFAALDDVQAVVGKGQGSEKLYKHFERYEYPETGHNY